MGTPNSSKGNINHPTINGFPCARLSGILANSFTAANNGSKLIVGLWFWQDRDRIVLRYKQNPAALMLRRVDKKGRA